ncbi:Ankyrin repeat protein 1 [Giardia muris]|uniref:Ankyrin repeat protein 1 n=1 Tax=Giardia muris TaxID=5742 RepID=A0A4Z1SPD9_GIAMU|nr:Ankyrin repeat protein 1 [Giardia muris]|eukprot:TNJ27692.1 Ankyrin repeat protein 1 [Giardia muris]
MELSSVQDWFAAVARHDAAAIRAYMKHFAGARNDANETALMVAARLGDLELARTLAPYESGLQGNNRQTALIQAILNERAEIVQLLLNDEIGIPISDGRTPFMVAASAGCARSLRLLTLRSSLDSDCRDLNALDYAVLGGHLECVRIILETQRPTSAQLEYSIHLARDRKHHDIIACLQRARADLQSSGTSGSIGPGPQSLGTPGSKVERTPRASHEPPRRSGSSTRLSRSLVHSTSANTSLISQNTSLLSTHRTGERPLRGEKRPSSRPVSTRAIRTPSSKPGTPRASAGHKGTPRASSSSKKARDRERDRERDVSYELLSSVNRELVEKTLEALRLREENEALKRTVASLRKDADETLALQQKANELQARVSEYSLEVSHARDGVAEKQLRAQVGGLQGRLLQVSQLLVQRETELAAAKARLGEPFAASGVDLAELLQTLVPRGDGPVSIEDLSTTMKPRPEPQQQQPQPQLVQSSSSEEEVQVLRSRCTRLTEELSEVRAELEAAKAARKRADEAVRNRDVELAEVREQHCACTADLRALQSAHEALGRDLAEARAALAGKNDTINSLIRRMTALRVSAEQEPANALVAQINNSVRESLGTRRESLSFLEGGATSLYPRPENREVELIEQAIQEQVDSLGTTPNLRILSQQARPGRESIDEFELELQSRSKRRAFDSVMSVLTAPPPTIPETSLTTSLTTSSDPSKKSEVLSGLDSYTPLMQAVIDDNSQGVGSSLGYVGATLADGTTALMLAVKYNRVEFLKTLAEKEAGITRLDGRMALHLALQTGNLRAVEVLADYEGPLRADVSRTNHVHTELMTEAERGSVIGVWGLVGAQAGLQDPDGRTALMLAARLGHVECVKVLAPREGKLRDNAGRTALDYACEAEDPVRREQCVTLLAQARAE